MQKKLITKLLVATILSMTISTGIAYAKTDTKNIDETNNKIVEEQQKSIINKEVAGEYKLDNNFKLGGVYALSNLDANKYDLGNSDQEQAYIFQLNYKGAKRTIPNTYGLWVAYKNIGELATFLPTYTNSFTGE